MFKEFLKDLLSGDVEKQIVAAQHVFLVARSIGRQSTFTDLLPALKKYCFPDKTNLDSTWSNSPLALPEVVATLAEVLNLEFFEFLGTMEYIRPAKNILLNMCHCEEPLIRQHAVSSLKLILQRISIFEDPLSVYRTLADAEFFPGRCSAAMLTATVYKKYKIREVLNLHWSFFKDEWPLVRLEAYKALIDIIPTATDPSFFHSDIFDNLKTLNDQVPTHHRQLLVQIIFTLLQHINSGPGKKVDVKTVEVSCFKFLSSLSEDDSWRIRLELVEYLPKLVQNINADRRKNFSAVTVTWILRLLKDSNDNVRKAMLLNLPSCIRSESEERTVNLHFTDPSRTTLSDILLSLCSTQNPEDELREALASVFVDTFLLAKLDRTKMLNLLLTLDDDSNPRIRQHFVSKLSDLIALGPQFRDFIEQNILKWNNDTRWRVKHAICQNMKDIAVFYGSSFNKTHFKDIYITYFFEGSQTIRHEACVQLKLLATAFRPAYIADNILPDIAEGLKGTNYLHRIVAFDLAFQLSEVIDANLWFDYFDPLVMKGTQDPVANARLAAFELIGKCTRLIRLSSRKSQYVGVMKEKRGDSDPDVAYFANVAWENFHQRLNTHKEGEPD